MCISRKFDAREIYMFYSKFSEFSEFIDQLGLLQASCSSVEVMEYVGIFTHWVTINSEFIKHNVACSFYSASALLAMQSTVLARGILSVCLSVCLSVRHVLVMCPHK